MNTLTESLMKFEKINQVEKEEISFSDYQKELKESIQKQVNLVNKNGYKNSLDLSRAYERAIQEGIHNFNPDKHWSDVTKCNIMATLHENKNDVEKTIDRVVMESSELNELFGLGKKKKKQQSSGPQPISQDKLFSHLRNKFSFMNKDDLTDERLMTAIKIGNNSLDWKDELKQEMQSGRLHNIEHWAYKGLDFMAGSRRWDAAAKADAEREAKKEQERQKSYNSKTWRGGHDPKAPSSGHYNRDGSWQYESLKEEINFEDGHTMDEYMKKYGRAYEDGELWDFAEEELKDGSVSPLPEQKFWKIDDRFYEIDESLKESAETITGDLRSDIFNAIANVCFEYNLRGNEPSIEDLRKEFDWFLQKWEEGAYDSEDEFAM